MEKCEHSFVRQDGGLGNSKQVENVLHHDEKHNKTRSLLNSCQDEQKLTEHQKEDNKEFEIRGSYGLVSADLKTKHEKKEKESLDEKNQAKSMQIKSAEEWSKRAEKRDGASEMKGSWFVMYCMKCGMWTHFDQKGGRNDEKRNETPQQWDLFNYQRPDGKEGTFRRSKEGEWVQVDPNHGDKTFTQYRNSSSGVILRQGTNVGFVELKHTGDSKGEAMCDGKVFGKGTFSSLNVDW